MRIENEFTVSVPIERAWEVLTDLAGIAPCMPGAQLTGVEGDVYSGKVKVKVGPVTSEYAGTARFVEKDDSTYHAVIDAKGRDSRGAGNASAAISAQLRADGPRTVVSVDTDLKISGKIAQFGSGMIKEVSTKLLGQFVECLERKVSVPAAVPSSAGAASESGPSIEAGSPSESGPSSESVPSSESGAQRESASPSKSGESAESVEPAAPAATAAREPAGESFAEAEPLRLMSVAAGPIYKRALPVLVVVLIIVALVVYAIVK
jgi:uncharacterized protein